MALEFTADELAEVRSYITWDPPTDADLNASYDRLGTKWKVIREELRKRYFTALANPSSFSIHGEYSEARHAEQLKLLRDQLEEVEANVAAEDGSGPVGVGHLARTTGPWRRGYPCR